MTSRLVIVLKKIRLIESQSKLTPLKFFSMSTRRTKRKEVSVARQRVGDDAISTCTPNVDEEFDIVTSKSDEENKRSVSVVSWFWVGSYLCCVMIFGLIQSFADRDFLIVSKFR